jgi:hypothetical protein
MIFSNLINRIALALGVFLVSINALANETGYLHVQISNQTGNDCLLLFQKTVHGKLDSSPPQSLFVNQSATFDISQTIIYGPDEILNYQCQSKDNPIAFLSVKFEISQPLSIVFGKMPSLKLLESHGLAVNVSYAESSSVLVNNKSLINIELRRE